MGRAYSLDLRERVAAAAERDGLSRREAAEISKMEFDHLAQLPLRTDSVAIADNEHADQQLGVDHYRAGLANPQNWTHVQAPV